MILDDYPLLRLAFAQHYSIHRKLALVWAPGTLMHGIEA